MEDSGGVTDSPKKGPTLSTSTSSFEALDPHDPNLSRLATKMFQKTGDFISSELTGPLEDYKLLENMNRATISKYSDMQQITENLASSTAELNGKLEELVRTRTSLLATTVKLFEFFPLISGTLPAPDRRD